MVSPVMVTLCAPATVRFPPTAAPLSVSITTSTSPAAVGTLIVRLPATACRIVRVLTSVPPVNRIGILSTLVLVTSTLWPLTVIPVSRPSSSSLKAAVPFVKLTISATAALPVPSGAAANVGSVTDSIMAEATAAAEARWISLCNFIQFSPFCFVLFTEGGYALREAYHIFAKSRTKPA